MQKPFRLSPLNVYLLVFSFALSTPGSGCRFNPDKQTPGQGYLQGDWQQDSVSGQKQLINYSLRHLTFSCDSFFVTIRVYSKVNTEGDSCTASGQWTEYCKGVYDQKNDTLHMKGEFCNADKSLKADGGCFRSGVYEEYFRITKKTDSLIRFASTTNVIPIYAHLIKRTSCIPKPL